MMARSVAEQRPRLVNCFAKSFVVNDHVFSPEHFPSTEVFCRALPFAEGLRFLEIGCGTGVISVVGALKGCSRVVAVDLNPFAVENARHNAELHNVAGKIDCRKGDLFGAIKADERFDLIFWNASFGWLEPDHVLIDWNDVALFDPGYNAISRYLYAAPLFTAAGGHAYLGFGSLGNLDRLRSVAHEVNRTLQMVGTWSVTEEQAVTCDLIEVTVGAYNDG